MHVGSMIATTVILAAGLGTRMKSPLPKVLHPVCGVPLLLHVLKAAEAVEAERTVVVLGHGHELVRPLLPEGTEVALQATQRGTGHALLSASEFVGEGPVLVLAGDTPLVTGEVLLELVQAHQASGADATLLTMEPADPTGYGRILRDPAGWVTRIVEHRDATEEERRVREVNAGMYVLPGRRALAVLEQAGTDNAQGEIYLTDVVAGLREAGGRVAAHVCADPTVTLGVNSRVELAEAQALMRVRLLEHWMLAGVTVEDPASTHIDAGVTLEADARILPFTCLRGRTQVGAGSEIGPGTTLVDTVVGRGCRVRHAYAEGAVLEAGARVDPFSYVGPVTVGHGAIVAAGSIMSRDVPAGAAGAARPQEDRVGSADRLEAGEAETHAD